MLRNILAASVLLISVVSASAGIMPAYQNYMQFHQEAKIALESNKAKLKPATYAQHAKTLEESKKRMEDGMSSMAREKYYTLAEQERRKVEKIKDSLGSN